MTASSTRPSIDGPHERLAERVHRGQFHVDARLERGGRRLAEVAGRAVQGLEERHREVVRDDGALEAPGLAQQSREQVAVGGGGHAVEVGVRVHHRTRPCVAHHHLERRQQHVGELPGADGDGGQVAARPRRRVPDEVLERRDDAGCLEPAHVRRAEGADQVRVLAHGLLDAAPPCVAHDVEHGGEPLVHADRAHVGADAACHLLDELGVEGRAPRERHRVGGRAVRGEARQAFLVHERRDAEPARRDDALLQPGERLRPERGIDRRSAEGPRDLAESLGQQRIEIHGRRSSRAGAGPRRRRHRRRRSRCRRAGRSSPRG